MDIFAAERRPREYSKASDDSSGDLIFPSYFVRQTGGSLLTEPCRLKLQVERNLEKCVCVYVGIGESSSTCPLIVNKYCFILRANRHILLIHYIKIIESDINLNVGVCNFLINESFNRFVFRVLNMNIEKNHLIRIFVPFLDVKNFLFYGVWVWNV